MLCSMIHEAGICTPHEYFQPEDYRPELEARWGVPRGDNARYSSALIERRTSSTGVLGINLHAPHLDDWHAARANFSAFPKVTHIFLWRRDKLAQATSFFIAHKTEKWSSAFGPARHYPEFDLTEIDRRARYIRNFEDRLQVEAETLHDDAFHLYYEDLLEDPECLQNALPEFAARPANPSTKRQSGPVENLYRRLSASMPRSSTLRKKRSISPTKVTVYPFAASNPYQNMMYSAGQDWLKVDFTTDSKTLLDGNPLRRRRNLVHIQWEEGVVWPRRSLKRTRKRVVRLQRQIRRHKRWGGKVLWTLHNERTSVRPEVESFAQSMRSFMIKFADYVHVHSQSAAEFAVSQLGIPRDRLIVVEHPSYEGVYGACLDPLATKQSRKARFMLFGRIRPYKGLDLMRDVFADEDVAGATQHLTIAGLADDDVQSELQNGFPLLKGKCTLRFEHVPDKDLAKLFSQTDFVLMPYAHSLTSGVAPLAMSFGKPVIAANLPGIREAVPPENMELLYDDPADLRQMILKAAALKDETYLRMREAAFDWAVEHSPQRQSARLLNELIDRKLILVKDKANL